MAIRNREELLGAVQQHFGDDTSDETLALIEDITDTMTELETKAKDTTDWKKKYDENDSAWRKKYRDRFFSGGSGEDDEPEEKPEPKKLTYENLFKEG